MRSIRLKLTITNMSACTTWGTNLDTATHDKHQTKNQQLLLCRDHK